MLSGGIKALLEAEADIKVTGEAGPALTLPKWFSN